jgi:hypothetical protein
MVRIVARKTSADAAGVPMKSPGHSEMMSPGVPVPLWLTIFLHSAAGVVNPWMPWRA